MSVAAERAMLLDRPCTTCSFRLRHLGRTRCIRDLVRAGVSDEHIRLYLSSAEHCEQQRKLGPLLARLMATCGREGRYWRSRS